MVPPDVSYLGPDEFVVVGYGVGAGTVSDDTGHGLTLLPVYSDDLLSLMVSTLSCVGEEIRPSLNKKFPVDRLGFKGPTRTFLYAL